MALVKDIIKSFDTSDELAQTQKEVVETLAKLGESKADTFLLQIQESLINAGTGGNKTVPISSVIALKKDVRAYSSTSVKDIGASVTKSLKLFTAGASDSLIEGIGYLISEALTTFLGEASASSGSMDEYYIMREELALVRIDFKSWYLNVTSKSISKKMERVSAFVAVKSTVDLSKIDFNTFLAVYQTELIATGKLTKQQVKEELAEAQAIYDLYRKYSKPSASEKMTVIDRPPASMHYVGN